MVLSTPMISMISSTISNTSSDDDTVNDLSTKCLIPHESIVAGISVGISLLITEPALL